ncbi:MAG: rhodanese-like domain-containing protein [Bacteroidales bacterium]|jgi:rhodanese-related sulfurtransferase|nr:rhodanese-like domain-containing protein [Bacteroidales bacterium]NLM92517.1 rhodanese-like domain-containing protein [Bacteroidales bacterium]
MSNKTLNNGAFLFFAILLGGLAANFIFSSNYKLSNRQVMTEFDGQGYFMNYAQLHEAIAGDKAPDYLFIDLRDEQAFAQGQIPGAVNIPFEKLLDKQSLKKIRKAGKKTPVLYAGEEATAQKARMLLLSRGIKEVKVLGGTFDMARRFAIDNFDPAHAFFKDEKARFVYLRFMQTSPREEEISRPAWMRAGC